MRGAFLITTLAALLIGGLIYAKRRRMAPHTALPAELVGAHGEPVKNLQELPKALEKQLKRLNDEANKVLDSEAP